MKKVIVTGGCGFIGSHLVEKLSESNHVVVIDNMSTGRRENIGHLKDRSIEVIEADLSISDPKWLHSLQGADKVFHLAALADIVPSIQCPHAYYNSNVTGTFNLLEAVRDNKIERFVYAGSSSCYGIPDIYPTPEDAQISPKYPYALTKRLGEELAMHWHEVYQIPVISLRFFNVYGPRSRTSGTYGAVFGVFLAQKLAGKPFTIVGNGTQTRDFTHVTDVCDAICTAAEHGKNGEIYNVGSGKTVSINRIVELLGGEKVYIPKRPGEPDSTFADIRKICYETGWQPRVTIEEGVRSMLDEIEYWQAAPVWDPQSIRDATKEWFEYLK